MSESKEGVRAVRQSVLDTARRMARLGLVVGTAGNVSARLTPSGSDGGELMAVTPAGAAYESMSVDDVAVTNFDLEQIEGNRPPSSESLLHVGIYRHRADARAVVHTHSVYSSALAVAGMDLPAVIDELTVYVGGAVRVSRYGFPGSRELADNVCAALGSNRAALIANHGAVAIGSSLDEALDVCLLVERAAQIYIMARSLGRVVPIPSEFVKAERAIYEAKILNAGETL